MSLHMPIDRRKIRNHFHYNFWMYLLLIVIAGFGWNLVYTTTRYRPPESAKIEFFAEGTVMASDAVQALADEIHKAVMPEMEEVTATVVSFDQSYGDMQLVVWVSAGQGDVYLLSKERFLSMAGNGGTLELEPLIANGSLHTQGLNLEGGYVSNATTDKQSLLGIPADQLVKLNETGLDTKGKVLCILLSNGNDVYSAKFLDYLLTHMQADGAASAVAPAATADDAAKADTAVAATATAVPEAAATPVSTATASVAPTDASQSTVGAVNTMTGVATPATQSVTATPSAGASIAP